MINKLTPEQIKEINSKCPYDQGIFVEPWGIPNDIKEPVIYSKYDIGGVSGGSCWDSSNPQPYYNSEPRPKFMVLDLILKLIYPSISYLDYKLIEHEIVSSEKTQWEYYGNRTDSIIEFLPLSKLYEILETI